jgi:tRNA (cmo5U34)-methyltransferase
LERLTDDSRYRFHTADFRSLEFGDERFDLVASSIAIHHLTAAEKQPLFAQLFRWLRTGGIFAYADQHAGASEAISARHHTHWHSASMDAGATESEWQMWMQHQSDHDHHDTLVDQIDWLRQAGFRQVDCPWRFLLWTVLQAEKSD